MLRTFWKLNYYYEIHFDFYFRFTFHSFVTFLSSRFNLFLPHLRNDALCKMLRFFSSMPKCHFPWYICVNVMKRNRHKEIHLHLINIFNEYYESGSYFERSIYDVWPQNDWCWFLIAWWICKFPLICFLFHLFMLGDKFLARIHRGKTSFHRCL